MSGVIAAAILVAASLVWLGRILLFNCEDLDRTTRWGFRFIWLCMAVAGVSTVIGVASSST